MRIRRWLLPAVLVVAQSAAIGGELRPYVLPSQQRNEAVQDGRVRTQAPSREPTVDDWYYEHFAQRARALKSDRERSELAQSFKQRHDAALRDGRTAEAAHYKRLLDILDATKTG